MNPTIRVLVLMKELVVRHQLRRLLALTNDIHLVGEALDIQQLAHAYLTLQPDLLLIDGGFKPFVFDLAALTAQISPPPKVIALLNPPDLGRAQALLATNLAGGLLQQEIDENLIHAIRAVAQGGTSFSRAVFECLIGLQSPLNARLSQSRP